LRLRLVASGSDADAFHWAAPPRARGLDQVSRVRECPVSTQNVAAMRPDTESEMEVE
jgi:hypothetical protein